MGRRRRKLNIASVFTCVGVGIAILQLCANGFFLQSGVWNKLSKKDDFQFSSVTTVTSPVKNFSTLSTNGLNYASLEKYPPVYVDCATHGRYPIIMQNTGIHEWVCTWKSERRVTIIMLYVFTKYANRNKLPGLMLDVGANAGYYSLLAGRLGHKSVQFDLQPGCLTILRNSAILNDLSDLMFTVPAGISDEHQNITVPDEGCDGQFPVSAHRNHSLIGTFNRTMPLHPLGHFVSMDKEIMLIKIDTEGNERRVLTGSMEFFRRRRIQNAIVEVTPGYDFWEIAGVTKQEVLDAFREICSFGYVMVSLHDSTIHRTAKEAVDYLASAEFEQADMWLTIDKEITKLTKPKLDPKVFSKVLGHKAMTMKVDSEMEQESGGWVRGDVLRRNLQEH